MNTIKVRDIEIGAGAPKIIVPIVGVTKDDIIAEAKTFDSIPVDMVEWRVDWFENVFEFDKVEEAVIEGGVETKPDNILIYATSNRRHLIKETWNDRNDLESNNGLHRSDTIEEKLSLVNRFGCQISYSKPSQKEFFDIVIGLARKNNVKMTDEELMAGFRQAHL